MIFCLIFLFVLSHEYDTCYTLQLYCTYYVEFVLLRYRVRLWLNWRIWGQWQ